VKSQYSMLMIRNPPRMKGIKAVIRPTVGDDIICLEVIDGSQVETIVCLGKKGSVRVPLGEVLRQKIERRFIGRLDWSEIEKGISRVMSHSKASD